MPKESSKTVKHVEEVDVSDTESADTNTIDCSDFNVDNFTIPPIDEKRSSDSQYHAFPTYKYGKKQDKLILKTDPIKITKGGIPKLDDKWRKTDAKREFMWLGIDTEQPACVALFDAFKQIDEHFDKLISYDADEKVDANVESKTVVFQKDKKKVEPLTVLEYSPLVKLSVQGGDGESKPDQPEYVPYERCKLKFGKKYDKDRKDGEPSELTTALFLGDKEDPEDLTYPSDFEKYLRWNCTAQFVLQFSKFRCKKAVEKDKKGKQIPRECAFDITILQVVITEEAPRSGLSNADKYRRRMFPSKSVAAAPPVEKKPAKKVEKEESSSESESSSEEDEAPPPKKSSKETKQEKAPAKKDAKSKKVDSDEEASEEEVPKKSTKETKQEKAPAKKDAKSKKVDSESEESSESSEEDSEDESSEEKPKPKAKSSKK
jgi:hypothetical protein